MISTNKKKKKKCQDLNLKMFRIVLIINKKQYSFQFVDQLIAH